VFIERRKMDQGGLDERSRGVSQVWIYMGWVSTPRSTDSVALCAAYATTVGALCAACKQHFILLVTVLAVSTSIK
jgi:hypothetical protein